MSWDQKYVVIPASGTDCQSATAMTHACSECTATRRGTGKVITKTLNLSDLIPGDPSIRCFSLLAFPLCLVGFSFGVETGREESGEVSKFDGYKCGRFVA